MLKTLLYSNIKLQEFANQVIFAWSRVARVARMARVAWWRFALSLIPDSATTTSENKPASSSSKEPKIFRMAFDFAHYLVVPIALSLN